MSVDLNRLKEKLKSQKNVSVDRNGTLDERDPVNDGSRSEPRGRTTLEPKRFFRKEREQ